jgi:hypothetical protein
LAEAQRLFGPDPLPHQRARILGVRLQIARVVGDLPLALKISTVLFERPSITPRRCTLRATRRRPSRWPTRPWRSPPQIASSRARFY